MEFWKLLGSALGNMVGAKAGAKMIQYSSDLLINRHTGPCK